MTRAQRATAAVAVLLIVLAGAVIAIRFAYGYFSGDYRVAGEFPRAGQDLVPGSDVKFRGVNVGKVKSIQLAGHGVRIVLRIHRGFGIPADAKGTVRPKTLFGEKYVALDFPTGQHAPYLRSGGRLAAGATSTEVEDLIAGATPLLARVNAADLATIVDELANGTRGEGTRIASGFDNGLKLANLFADTIQAQVQALDSWARFQDAIRTTGGDLDAIAAANNVALPELNRAEADFQRLLTTLKPFSDDLAALLAGYRPDIDALLDRGDNVVRVLVARQNDLRDSIHGLYRYVFKFARSSGAETLADGSKFAFFKNFILFSDVNTLICGVLAPPQPSAPQLVALQQAIVGAGSPLDCSAYFAKGGAAAPAGLAAQRLAVAMQQAVGTPDQTRDATVGDMVRAILGEQR